MKTIKEIKKIEKETYKRAIADIKAIGMKAVCKTLKVNK